MTSLLLAATPACQPNRHLQGARHAPCPNGERPIPARQSRVAAAVHGGEALFAFAVPFHPTPFLFLPALEKRKGPVRMRASLAHCKEIGDPSSPKPIKTSTQAKSSGPLLGLIAACRN